LLITIESIGVVDCTEGDKLSAHLWHHPLSRRMGNRVLEAIYHEAMALELTVGFTPYRR